MYFSYLKACLYLNVLSLHGLYDNVLYFNVSEQGVVGYSPPLIPELTFSN